MFFQSQLIFKNFCNKQKHSLPFSERSKLFPEKNVNFSLLNQTYLKKSLLLVVFVLFLNILFFAHATAQNHFNSFENLTSSRHGYILPSTGVIRVLLIFVEIQYDDPTLDPSANGTAEWPKGQLPLWKDSLFDPFASKTPRGIFTKYYYDASFGNLIVLGDYLVSSVNEQKPFTIKTNSTKISVSEILKQISATKGFRTKHHLQQKDFDLLTLTHIGHPKISPSIDNPLRYDHVCIIVRNTIFPKHLSGWTASNCSSALFGYNCDSYSFICTHGVLPFNIFLHEFNHLLIGGNNFHAGGSHSKKAGASYFVHIQGGWSMMSAAYRSLLTPNAFDRYRLGWKPSDKQWFLSAINSDGTEIPTDLTPYNSQHQGTYVLRDFMTTGDAIRIRLPHIPSNQFQQWLWIENHQKLSPFDKFQYETDPCMPKALKGLYMFIQIDHEQIEGTNVFDRFADYIYPLPASGFFDFKWYDHTIQNNWCLNNENYYPISFEKSLPNPLSGNHLQELIFFDYNNDNKIDIEEYRIPASLHRDTNYRIFLPLYGSDEFAFVPSKHKYISNSTNPPTTNRMTCVSASTQIFNLKSPDVRSVYLNGITIEIIGHHPIYKDAIVIKVKFNDFVVRNNVRWCADTIVFRSMQNSKPDTLIINPKVKVTIDRGLAATKLERQNNDYYTNPSIFVVDSGAVIWLKRKSEIRLENNSQMILKDNALIILEKLSKIKLSGNSNIIIYPNAKIIKNQKKRH